MQMDTGPTTTTMATDGNHDLGHRIESAYRGVYKIHGSVLSPSSLREKVRQRCLAKMSSTRAELVQRFRAGGTHSCLCAMALRCAHLAVWGARVGR